MTEKVGLTAKVVHVTSRRQIVINRGEVDGVSLEDRYVVYKLGKQITDPETGENLGRLEHVKGRGKVIHVQERVSTLETYEQTKLEHPTSGFQLLTGGSRWRYIQKEFVDARVGDEARQF